MASEDVLFRWVADTGQFVAAQEQARGRAEQAAVSVERAAGKTSQLHTNAAKAAPALVGLASSMSGVGGAAGKLGSALSTLIGGGGGGGGVLAAVGVGVTGVTLLIRSLQAAHDAAAKAAANHAEFLRNIGTAGVADAARATADLRQQLSDATDGLSPMQRKVRDLKDELGGYNRQLAWLAEQSQGVLPGDRGHDFLTQQVARARELRDHATEQVELAEQLNLEQLHDKSVSEAIADEKERAARARAAAAAAAERERQADQAWLDTRIDRLLSSPSNVETGLAQSATDKATEDSMRDLIAEHERFAASEIAIRANADRAIVDGVVGREQAMTDAVRDGASQRRMISEAEHSMAVAALDVFASTALETTMGVTEALIEGQELSLQGVISGSLKAVGTQIAAIGLRGVIEGGILSMNPKHPGAGVPMALAGAAAIAIGLGMGAVGSYMAPPSATSVGPIGGSPGMTAPISSGGFGGASGGSSTVNITINNGVGMARDDTRRAVASALRDAYRSGDLRPGDFR